MFDTILERSNAENHHHSPHSILPETSCVLGPGLASRVYLLLPDALCASLELQTLAPHHCGSWGLWLGSRSSGAKSDCWIPWTSKGGFPGTPPISWGARAVESPSHDIICVAFSSHWYKLFSSCNKRITWKNFKDLHLHVAIFYVRKVVRKVIRKDCLLSPYRSHCEASCNRITVGCSVILGGLWWHMCQGFSLEGHTKQSGKVCTEPQHLRILGCGKSKVI